MDWAPPIRARGQGPSGRWATVVGRSNQQLKLQNPRALKSFIAECEALRNMRHRNLVKIITACASIDARGDDFKAIVYDFMPNGSLDGWIHADANEQTRERSLGLSE